jgi:hypothetical protein
MPAGVRGSTDVNGATPPQRRREKVHMRFTRLRSPAIVTCSALLVAAAGAAMAEPVIARAAALITGSDVRDGTLTTKDVKDGSLTRKDFQRGAVTTRAVRDGTLTARDFAPGTLPAASGGSAAPGGAGPQGAPGAQGPPGPAGPQGESGFVRVFAIGNTFGSQALPGFSGTTIVVPEGCQTKPCCETPPYTAQDGDVAILSLSATGSPTQAINDVLYVVPMRKLNGDDKWSRATSPLARAAESLSDGTAHATAQAVAQLQAGTVYRWAVGIASNNPLTINPGFCQGTVTIVRTTD